MTISVIIPTLNEHNVLAKTLTHTASLGLDEIIVVDGGSTDLTVPTAQAFCTTTPDTHLITAPRGRARQMNEGAKASRGDVLLFLHADTQLPEDTGRLIESAFIDPTVVGGRFDVRFGSSSLWSRVISSFMNRRSRLTGISTGDQTLFVRRQVFERLGGFLEIPLMEDIDFSRRLKRAGRVAALRNTVTTSFRRWETQGPLRTILLMWTLRFLYWTGVSPHRLHRFYAAIR
ncbi:MAG TPA: TIGR04283 family arsenosugar biosynthesis glycosyltransferase [Nitrospira sp.]|nr:TIGR04283 family arsenosugar biosynthesis glycosyltransferase [Nitrospira sp.]